MPENIDYCNRRKVPNFIPYEVRDFSYTFLCFICILLTNEISL